MDFDHLLVHISGYNSNASVSQCHGSDIDLKLTLKLCFCGNAIVIGNVKVADLESLEDEKILLERFVRDFKPGVTSTMEISGSLSQDGNGIVTVNVKDGKNLYISTESA